MVHLVLMIKAIVFDCFGVLVVDAFNVMIKDLKVRQPELAQQIIHIINDVVEGKIEPRQSSVQISELLGLSVEEYTNKLESGQVKNSELLDYILTLKKEYKIGVLSNVGKGGIAKLFSEDEINTYFDVALGSGDIGYAKPNIYAYEAIADSLCVELSSCVMVDDYGVYCEAAAASGMKAIKYVSVDQLKTDLSKLL